MLKDYLILACSPPSGICGEFGHRKFSAVTNMSNFQNMNKWVTLIYPSLVDCVRGLKKEYPEETLLGVSRLPSEIADFAQVVVAR